MNKQRVDNKLTLLSSIAETIPRYRMKQIAQRLIKDLRDELTGKVSWDYFEPVLKKEERC